MTESQRKAMEQAIRAMELFQFQQRTTLEDAQAAEIPQAIAALCAELDADQQPKPEWPHQFRYATVEAVQRAFTRMGMSDMGQTNDAFSFALEENIGSLCREIDRGFSPDADQQTAEPVAWLVTSKRGLVRAAWTTKPSDEQVEIAHIDGDTITPLYAHLQPTEPTEAQIEAGARAIVKDINVIAWERASEECRNFALQGSRIVLQAAMSVKE